MNYEGKRQEANKMGLLKKPGPKQEEAPNYLRLTKAMIQVLEQDHPTLFRELKKNVRSVKDALDLCITDNESGDLLNSRNSAFLLGYELALLGNKIAKPKVFDREVKELSRKNGKLARKNRWGNIDDKRAEVLSLWDKQGNTKFKNSRKEFIAHYSAKGLLTERGISDLLASERPARKKRKKK